jgi:hypothetical protein
MLLDNIAGNYNFIRGIGPFSAAVAARPGFEIVHAAFNPFVPLANGYELLERHLRNLRRSISALCGMQLRIPKALSRQGFDEFNRPYIDRLKSWGLEVDGANPVTRTNVALEVNPVAEPMLAGFFYSIPAAGHAATWVLSGVPEIAARDGANVQIVARGDTSAAGMRMKTECIMQVLSAHLAEMGAGWEQATTVNLYTVQDMHPLMASTLLPALGRASQAGVVWHYATPPVTGLDLEIDACAVRRELVLS